MFNLFKPKPAPVTAQSPQPSSIPTPPQNETMFEVGKEIQIRDPKTGEFIYRIAMSPEHRKLVFDVIQKNAGVGQRLINLSINLTNILRQLDIEDKGRIETEKNIEATVNKVRDEMKLDKRWGLNMQLGVLERREPPE